MTRDACEYRNAQQQQQQHSSNDYEPETDNYASLNTQTQGQQPHYDVIQFHQRRTKPERDADSEYVDPYDDVANVTSSHI